LENNYPAGDVRPRKFRSQIRWVQKYILWTVVPMFWNCPCVAVLCVISETVVPPKFLRFCKNSTLILEARATLLWASWSELDGQQHAALLLLALCNFARFLMHQFLLLACGVLFCSICRKKIRLLQYLVKCKKFVAVKERVN
jgi:hypothetical protein